MRQRQLFYDQLAILPLRVLGPEIDKRLQAEEARDWYDYVVGEIQTVSDAHDEQCLEGRTITSTLSCEASDLCPWRFASSYLEQDIRMPDANDERYKAAPQGYLQLANAKMEVGLSNGLIKAASETHPLSSYRKMFTAILKIVNKVLP